MIIAALIASVLGAAVAPGPPGLNTSAPAFRLPALNGAPIALSGLRGRVVVLNFFATWCPPCRAETPDLIALQRRYGTKGVAFLGIDDRESAALVQAFVKAKGIRYRVALDGEGKVDKRYDVRAIPTTYVLDRFGVVRYRQVDELDRSTLTLALDAAIQGKPLPQSVAARRFGEVAERATREMQALTATAHSALAARNAGIAGTDASAAIKLGTAAGTQLDRLQSSSASSSIDYFASTRQRDALDLALAGAYEVRAASDHAAASKTDAEQAALLRGQDAQDAERFADAERWYAKAAALTPTDVAAFDGEYLAAYELHDYHKAADAAAGRARAAPSDPESWLTAASAQMSLHRYGQALDAARRGLGIAVDGYAKHPSKPATAYELGRVWLKMARIELAAGSRPPAEALLRDAIAAAPQTIVAQQAQEQLGALAEAPVGLGVWGPARVTAGASSPASLYVIVRNPSAQSRSIELLSAGLPPHWVLSFCYGTVCNPNRSTLTLRPKASRRIELQVVPLAGAGSRWTLSLRPTGGSSVGVAIKTSSLKAAVSVSAS